MNDEQWGERMVRSIGLLLNGDGLPDRDERGAPVRDDTFYALLHADPDGAEACIPGDLGTMWRIVFDTAHQVPFPDQGDLVPAGAAIPIAGRSVILLRREPPAAG